MSTLQEKDKTYIAGTYARFPVDVVRGKGSEVFDTAGKRYIDMGSGIGVTAFGIADDAWIDAVTAQLARVQHTSNLYYTESCVALAELLCCKTGMKKVFFGNSGAEANECAIKVARKYACDKYGPERNAILTLENSFHGRTLTTLAATGQAHYHELYTPLTPGFFHTPMGDFEALARAAKEHNAAAVLVECIQGEGGVLVAPREFLQKTAAFCRENDILLMVDEVQTGNGRTGKLYAYEHYGITPDVVTTAKGLGGGLPIGAALLGEKVANVFGFGDHGSTFGGNPVAAAGAVSVLSRIDDTLLAEVTRKGQLVREMLTGAKGVVGISGIGLMVGVETVHPAAAVVRACIERGVLFLTAKNKVRLLPALNIPENDLIEALEVLRSICAKETL